MKLAKEYAAAILNGQTFPVVHPKHFRSAPTPRKGLGLFCDVDLVPGDYWWVNDLADPRFVAKVIPWEEYKKLRGAEKTMAEILCYLDWYLASLVLCAEPFCRVNHSSRRANSSYDAAGNSIITHPVAAGEEVLVSYSYETVGSIAWKFPDFKAQLMSEELAEDAYLLKKVVDDPKAMAFLDSLE